MSDIWDGHTHLGYTIAWDTETTVVPFTETADLVTMQVCNGEEALFVRLDDVNTFFKVHASSILIAHNCAFDIDVICKFLGDRNYFHNKLERDLLRDTMIEYKLVRLAYTGIVPMKAGLDLLYSELIGKTLDKNEDIRLTFDRYLNQPVENISKEHANYALQDAVATWEIYDYLIEKVNKLSAKDRLSEQIQIAGSIALNRIYKRGIGFDLDSCASKLEEIDSHLNKCSSILASYGWVRGQKGVKDRYDNVIKYLNINIPKTESGNFSTKAEDLEEHRGIHFVDTFLEFMEYEKLASFIREVSSDRLHPRYNFLVNTGRTSCSSPNIQQLPRSGGIRELFIAKPGHTFIITDYSAVELCTLSQVTHDMYGQSTMMEKINKGEDLHRYYASVLLGKKQEDITKAERQSAKAANFGFPGGLGIETFITYAKKSYNTELTREEAKKMKDKWMHAFPEMLLYLKEECTEAVTRTGRIRGDVTYCAGKNTPFQGLAADGAKIAMYYLDHAGFNIVAFVHDEIVSEVPEDKAEEMLKEQERIMIEAMKQVVPDVKISVESMITKRYSK